MLDKKVTGTEEFTFMPVLDIDSLGASVAKQVRLLADTITPTFRLMPPWVLVLLLPREQKIGSIITPEATQGIHQNKVVLEGVVLHTWQPYYKHNKKEVDGNVEIHTVYHEPSVVIGDHVLFEHWAGHNLTTLSKDLFRVVKDSVYKPGEGGIFATVEYEEPETLSQYMDAASQYTDVLDYIKARYYLIDKTKTSVTLSGR